MMTRNNYYAGVLSVLLGISLIAGTFPVNTYAAENVNYNNADITISSAEELVEFSKNAVADSYTEGKIIAITKDIDLTGVDFKPIAVLAGTLDGNGHVISGFSLKYFQNFFNRE